VTVHNKKDGIRSHSGGTDDGFSAQLERKLKVSAASNNVFSLLSKKVGSKCQASSLNTDRERDISGENTMASLLVTDLWYLITNGAHRVKGCIQKFLDWLPGAKTANGTALCH
jgi:hypothetical protein